MPSILTRIFAGEPVNRRGAMKGLRDVGLIGVSALAIKTLACSPSLDSWGLMVETNPGNRMRIKGFGSGAKKRLIVQFERTAFLNMERFKLIRNPDRAQFSVSLLSELSSLPTAELVGEKNFVKFSYDGITHTQPLLFSREDNYLVQVPVVAKELLAEGQPLPIVYKVINKEKPFYFTIQGEKAFLVDEKGVLIKKDGSPQQIDSSVEYLVEPWAYLAVIPKENMREIGNGTREATITELTIPPNRRLAIETFYLSKKIGREITTADHANFSFRGFIISNAGKLLGESSTEAVIFTASQITDPSQPIVIKMEFELELDPNDPRNNNIYSSSRTASFDRRSINSK